MNGCTSDPERAPWRAATALGLLAAAAFVLLRRDTSHEYDLYWLLPRLQRGDLELPTHPLALPAAHAWATLLEFTGAGLHDRLRIACGISTGLAVGIYTHVAWLLLRDRRLAVGAALLFACLPPTAYFATIMELHAPFLPAAALATWFAVRAVARPGLGAGLLLGAGTAVATGLHATGHLLAGTLALWLCWQGRSRHRWRAIVAALLGVTAAHVLGGLLLRVLCLSAASPSPAAAQLDFLLERPFLWNDLHRTVLGEWFVPFFPVSIACWWAARTANGLAVPLAIGLLANLLACQAMLVLPERGYAFHEFGAYQLPLAFLAVVMTVQVASARWRLAILLTAVLTTAFALGTMGKEKADAGFARVATAYLDRHPVRLVVECFAEYDGVFELALTGPDAAASMKRVLGTHQLLLEANRLGAKRAADMALFFHPHLAGVTTVITDRALQQLRAEGGLFAELVDEALPALYARNAVLEVDADGHRLSGWRLDAK